MTRPPPRPDEKAAPPPPSSEQAPSQPWRAALYRVIFEAETPAGKAFDVALLLLILLSIAAVMAESVATLRIRYGPLLWGLEWTFTLLFLLEYILRLISVRNPWRYAVSFFGIIDLAAVLPTFVSIAFPGAQSLLVVRAFPLLRVFRVFKLARFLGEAGILVSALRRSLPKVTVFLGTVLTVDLTVGALMYLIEGPESGFSDIPTSMYWAIVTMTTVGFGDITPLTAGGRFLASALMILGYGIIAVPTGIFSVEIAQAMRMSSFSRSGPACLHEGHESDARHCRLCGASLT